MTIFPREWRHGRTYLGLRTRAQIAAPLLSSSEHVRYLAPLLDTLVDNCAMRNAPPTVAEITVALNSLAGAARTPLQRLPGMQVVRSAYGHAIRHWVLTLRESAALAARAVRRFAPGAGIVELSCVKEGNTSSVWRAVYARSSARMFAVGVLVPRDAMADVEQSATVDCLSAMRAHLGNRIMAVHAQVGLELARGPRRRHFRVAVVEWLDGARELHVLSDATDEMPQVMIIEAFTNGDRPAGRAAEQSEGAQILAECRALLLSTVAPAADGQLTMCRTELNDGDFVLDGNTVRLVAASLPGPRIAVHELIREYALLAARNAEDGAPIYIAPPAAAAMELRACLPAAVVHEGALKLLGNAEEHPRVHAIARAITAVA